MAVSELLAATIILNEGGIAANATMPTITAGADRVVPVTAIAYSGGGQSSVPTAVTCNGRTAQWINGDSGLKDRATMGMWMFNESDIPFISGQTLVTSGASGSLKSIHVRVLQDCDQSVPVNSNQGWTSASTGMTLPLTRGATSLTVADVFTQSTGTLFTFTNPTRTGSVDYTNRDVSSAVASDTAGTVNFTTTTASGGNRTTAVVVNFLTKASYDITSINGGTNSVQIGSSGNTVETVNLTGVTAASLNGIAMTSVAGSSSPWTFTCPPLTDEAVSPYPSGTFSVTGTEGSPTLNDVDVTLPDGLVEVTLSGTINDTITGVVYDFDPAAVVTDKIFYPPDPSGSTYIIVDAQGNIDTNHSGTVEFWHWQASTGITRSYDVIVGNGGVIGVSSSKNHYIGLGIGIGF